ncbi:MAG: hypothetical protein M3171_11060 [Actinomycetota bacterium]|nr:hypothetical protein [Actinomycetota bacterium]
MSYQDNVNAGSAHVSVGLADVAGYQGSNAFSTFTINKAPTSTRIGCPSVVPTRASRWSPVAPRC